jgi:plasmid maintenance system killer protein
MRDTSTPAASISDLRVPPGNRLEKLVGDRKAQYSIRIKINGESALFGRMRIMLRKLK